MRRLLVAPLCVAALVIGSAAGADAADSVRIKSIATKTAPYKKTTTIKPTYTTSGRVAVSAATLTVKKGRKTVRRNAKSAKLKAGRYTVTQKVTYRTYANVAAKKLTVAAGSYVSAWADEGASVMSCTISTHTPIDEHHGAFSATCPVT